MTKFIMMVGIVGSSKSTYALELAEKHDAKIIESDAYREQAYGSAEIQGDNNALFEKIHKDVIELLVSGRNVIFDATNISAKKRMAFLQTIGKLNVEKICVLAATEYDLCYSRNMFRERRVPSHVVERMWKTINIPQYYEGWDKIEILWDYDPANYSLEKYLLSVRDFNQDTSYHSLTLGEHTYKVVVELHQNDKLPDMDLVSAALLHDNGKRYTKNFKNAKGEPTEIAHYYNHEFVGAYEALFYLKEQGYDDSKILEIAGIVMNHMRSYGLNTDKAIDKFKNLVGEDMFTKVMILNKADRAAH